MHPPFFVHPILGSNTYLYTEDLSSGGRLEMDLELHKRSLCMNNERRRPERGDGKRPLPKSCVGGTQAPVLAHQSLNAWSTRLPELTFGYVR